MKTAFFLSLLILLQLCLNGQTELSLADAKTASRDSVSEIVRRLINEGNPHAALFWGNRYKTEPALLQEAEWMVAEKQMPRLDSSAAGPFLRWKEQLKAVKKPALKKKRADSLLTIRPQNKEQQYFRWLQLAENMGSFGRKKVNPEIFDSLLTAQTETAPERLNNLLVAREIFSLVKNKKQLMAVERGLDELKAEFSNREKVYFREWTEKLIDLRKEEQAKKDAEVVPVKEPARDILPFVLAIASGIIALLFFILWIMVRKKRKRDKSTAESDTGSRHFLEKETIYQEQLAITRDQVVAFQKQLESTQSEISLIKGQFAQNQYKKLTEVEHHLDQIRNAFEELKRNPGVSGFMEVQNGLTRLQSRISDWKKSI